MFIEEQYLSVAQNRGIVYVDLSITAKKKGGRYTLWPNQVGTVQPTYCSHVMYQLLNSQNIMFIAV